MRADCTPPRPSAPSGGHHWPPAPTPRESITIEPDPFDDGVELVTIAPAPLRHRPARVRTYITAAGVVRVADAPKPRRIVTPPVELPDDAPPPPRIRAFPEEV